MSNWDTYQSSDVINLSGVYQIAELSATDWVVALKPGELAHVDIEYVRQVSAPTENLDVIVQRSGDGVKFESPGEAERAIIQSSNRESDLVPVRSITVVGVYAFQVSLRLRTPTDAVGGTDTATAYVHIRKDGVDVGSLP